MSTTAEVRLWGRTIGAVDLPDNEQYAAFEYSRNFLNSGIELSPLVMPVSNRLYTFPALTLQTFHGLPGLLADSLPDRFGNALIDSWLAREGRNPGSFNAVERLCYTGSRGMGALEYKPVKGPKVKKSKKIEIDKLVELASEILTQRNNLETTFSDTGKENALKQILQVGTSAGGARAKAVIAWNPLTNEVRSGQVQAGEGFEYWLLKFDGVSGNKDKELEDPKGYGIIEYAYSKMASDAGITMSKCSIFEENGRRHFMTKRFDRETGGRKIHMQSLCALGHYDFNMPGAYSYEQSINVIKQLGLPMKDVEEMYRRMIFNIIARNQDDHVKNIAFLMNKQGEWSLSPAFDIMYSYNPDGAWTSSHQMTMNGKRNHFTYDDFLACAENVSMKARKAKDIINEVFVVVSKWNEYAEEEKISSEHRDKITDTLRLDIL